MGYIKEDQIKELKDRLDIVDIISEYINLKRVGSNFKGLCPFHNEKTPSFMVSRDRNSFHCFGCHERGDVISFIMKIENLSYVDAIKFLADKAGMILDETEYSQEKINRINRMYEINSMAAKFYMKNLLTHDKPQKYLLERNLKLNILNKFFLGYAKSDNGLLNYLKQKKVSEQEMLDLGLINNYNGKLVDKFQERLIFPIINNKTKVIGFGARTINNNKIKYLNSPESSVFIKGKNIYGINIVNKSRNRDKILLVEGYMDVIGLYNQGIDYAVATLGTALTEDQARLVKRYGENIYIAYDGDNAGVKATLRAIDIFKNMDVNLNILEFPDNLDPDEFINKYGKEEFEKLLKNAINPLDFKLQKLSEIIDNKKNLINEIIIYLSDFKGNVIRDLYIDKAAKFLGVSVDSLRKDVEININKNNEKKNRPLRKNQNYKNGYNKHINSGYNLNSYVYNTREKLEKEIIIYSIIDKDNFLKLNKYKDFIKNKDFISLYDKIFIYHNENNDLNDILNSEEFNKYNLREEYENSKDIREYNNIISELLQRIENISLKDRLEEIKKILTSGEKDETLMEEYLNIYKKLT